jgi:hypothetical protein
VYLKRVIIASAVLMLLVSLTAQAVNANTNQQHFPDEAPDFRPAEMLMSGLKSPEHNEGQPN